MGAQINETLPVTVVQQQLKSSRPVDEPQMHLIDLNHSPDRRTTFRHPSAQLTDVQRFPAIDAGTIGRANLVRERFITNDCRYKGGFLGRAISRTTLWKKAFELMITVAEDYVIGVTVEKQYNRVMNSTVEPFAARASSGGAFRSNHPRRMKTTALFLTARWRTRLDATLGLTLRAVSVSSKGYRRCCTANPLVRQALEETGTRISNG